MREAQEGRVHWPDVDIPTFDRFIHWVYTQDYDTPEPTVIASAEPQQSLAGLLAATSSPVEPVNSTPFYLAGHHGSNIPTSYSICVTCKTIFAAHPCGDDQNTIPETCLKCQNDRCCRCGGLGKAYGLQSINVCGDCDVKFNCRFCENCKFKYPSSCVSCRDSARKAQMASHEKLVKRFNIKPYPRPTRPPAIEFKAQKNKDNTENYSDVFLCHTKLYVLGDVYLIPELKQLAIHRLHAMLKVFVLYPSRLGDITTLVKYTFENAQPEDEICEMLSLYCACNVQALDDGDGLELLMTEVPNFGSSPVRKMR